MTEDDVHKLVSLVGRSGAIHALVGSKRITVAELRKLVCVTAVYVHSQVASLWPLGVRASCWGGAPLGSSLGLTVSRETKTKAAECIVRHVDKRISKSLDELEALTQHELYTYLNSTNCDVEEIKELLTRAHVPIQGKMSRADLLEFAAAQISSLGMFKRISSSDCSGTSVAQSTSLKTPAAPATNRGS